MRLSSLRVQVTLLQRQEDAARYVEGLRKAGLPE
jgi:hypothetical protein